MKCLSDFILIGPDSNTFKAYLDLAHRRGEKFHKVVYLKHYPVSPKFHFAEKFLGRHATSNIAKYLRYRNVGKCQSNVEISGQSLHYVFSPPDEFLKKQKTTEVLANDINEPAVLKLFQGLSRNYKILFSGGGIIRSQFFDLGFQIYHCHLGFLPEFRGSNSCYWHILADQTLGASVIEMNRAIDGGNILYRTLIKDLGFLKEHKNQISEGFIDKFLDPYLRATAIDTWLQSPDLNLKQDTEVYRAYYKMHKELKRLAIERMKDAIQ